MTGATFQGDKAAAAEPTAHKGLAALLSHHPHCVTSAPVWEAQVCMIFTSAAGIFHSMRHHSLRPEGLPCQHDTLETGQMWRNVLLMHVLWHVGVGASQLNG